MDGKGTARRTTGTLWIVTIAVGQRERRTIMSIILDVPMPKTCGECPCFWHDAECYLPSHCRAGSSYRESAFDNSNQDELPKDCPIKYEDKWIPCTPETMPKHTDDYLVKVGVNYFGEGMYENVRTALYSTVWKKWYVHESEKAIVGEVTAWKEIPRE